MLNTTRGLKITQSEEDKLRRIAELHDLQIDRMRLSRRDVNELLNPRSYTRHMLEGSDAQNMLFAPGGGTNVREARYMLKREFGEATSLKQAINVLTQLQRTIRKGKFKKPNSALSVQAYLEGFFDYTD